MKDSSVLIFLDSLDLGGLGVKIFFVISGYLVMESWIRDPCLHRYASRRALRIFPALIGVVLLSMFVLGPLVTELPLMGYFHRSQLFVYLETVLLFWMPYTLPWVFYRNPYPFIVNGSLWTLAYEATLYVLLPVLVLLKPRGSTVYWILAALLLVVMPGVIGSDLKIGSIHIPTLCNLGAYFFYGVAFWALKTRLGTPRLSVAAVFCLILLLTWYSRWFPTILQFLLGYIVIAIGLRATPLLSSVGRFGDFSYGIYIYAFPVQQTIAHLGIAKGSVVLNFVYLVTATVLLAAFSWFVIERPALSMKPRKPRSSIRDATVAVMPTPLQCPANNATRSS
jgi:peptidoglycan/LPS O-acetylase OafA/YrhL